MLNFLPSVCLRWRKGAALLVSRLVREIVVREVVSREGYSFTHDKIPHGRLNFSA